MEKILVKVHPGDFQRIRVTQGDGSLDGFVINQLRVYQCFGPRHFTDSDAAAKIRRDFVGAHSYLEGKLQEWVFIHNDREGKIGKKTAKALADLKALHPNILMEVWGFDSVWNAVSNLADDDKWELLGPSISESAMSEVQFPEIEHVLNHVRDIQFSPNDPLGELPDADKLKFNELSDDAKAHLELGARKEFLVGRYLQATHRVTYGERVAKGFRDRYMELVDEGMGPDDIFGYLLEFAGWRTQLDVKHSSAVFAVMCYFFNACTIFENPPKP